MSQIVIAFVGLSGVGKSTLLRLLNKEFKFQHLQASTLIRDARVAASQAAVSSDSLRLANIEENQKLLADGFSQARAKDAHIVVLDGHTVIDTPDGLQSIETHVFAAMGVRQFIFLADEPAKIRERRAGDTGRNRPVRTVSELGEHQNLALINALKASIWMRIPIVVLTPDQTQVIRKLFELNV